MTQQEVDYAKQRTLELYNSLPQEESERKKYLNVRDEIIELNYPFFGYVASHTFINDPNCTYEDKLQSCLSHFLECWWWYKYEARYRTDLSFTVFFKPRLGEMIERELNIVKYSARRALCMKVGEQLNKHWGQVTYDDLALVKLSADDTAALQRMFGAMYPADLEQTEMFVPGSDAQLADLDIEKLYSDEYDTIEELLIHQMVEDEKLISDAKLHQLSDMYGIEYDVLVTARPVACRMLKTRLEKIRDERFDL